MNKTSIIIVALDKTERDRQMTGSCIGTIEMNTNREDYELILVDQMAFETIGAVANPGVLKYTPIKNGDGDHRYLPVVLDKYIEVPENIGLSAAYNLGAKNATGKYLVFMHNDIFLPDNWLPNMIKALEENKAKIITPHQGPTTREEVKRWSQMTHKELMNEQGHYDAGLLLMKTEFFKSTPGFDEAFKIIFPGMVFVRYICNCDLYCTPEVNMIHFGARDQDPKLIMEEQPFLYSHGYLTER